MYQKKGQLKKGAMWETQCHINLASIPPIKILMGMILGMVCGIEFTGFTTIGDFQKPWKILEGQGLVYFWVGSSSRTCRGTSRLDLFGTLKMTDLMKHDTILMKKSKTHLYIYIIIYIFSAMAANSWLPLLYGGIVLDASNIIFQSLQKKVTTDHSFASSWLMEICSDISSMFKKHGKSHL